MPEQLHLNRKRIFLCKAHATRDTIPYFFASSRKKTTFNLTGIFVYKLCGIKSCDVVLSRENLKVTCFSRFIGDNPHKDRR